MYQTPLRKPVGRPEIQVGSVMNIEEACALVFVVLRKRNRTNNQYWIHSFLRDSGYFRLIMETKK